MSLVVHQAYRLKIDGDFQSSLFDFMNYIKSKHDFYINTGNQLMNKLFSDWAVKALDDISIGKTNSLYISEDLDIANSHILYGVFNKYNKSREEAGKYRRHPETDFALKVVIYGLENEKEILVRFLTEYHKEYIGNIVDEYKKIHEFSYDGRSDNHGTNISDEEWELRYDLWYKTTKNSNLIGANPIVMEIIDDNDNALSIPSAEDICKYRLCAKCG